MNAIIVSLKGTFAAALSEDGSVVRIANDHYVIGQVIEMKKITATKQKMLTRIIAAAACLVLLCGFGGGAFAYLAPASYVSLDVNPSIEYTLNMFDRVLSVHAVNEDGAEILQQVNLKDFNNKTIDEAIKLTLTAITKEGYFAPGHEGGIVIATSGKNHDKAEHLAQQLGQIVTTQCKENQRNVKVETLAINQGQMDEAKALGTTPGKLALVQELQEHYTGTAPFDTKAWLAKPVKELMAEVARTEALDDADDKDDVDDIDDDKDDIDDKDDVNDVDDKDDIDDKDDMDDKDDDAKDAAEDAKGAAKDAEEDAAEAAEDAAEDAKEAKEKAADQAREAKDHAKDTADKKRDAAEEALEATEDAKEEAAEAAEDAAEDAAEAAEDAKEDAADQESHKPAPAKPATKPAATVNASTKPADADAPDDLPDGDDDSDKDSDKDDVEDDPKPAPTKPAPAKPEPAKPAPAKPEPTKPEPTKPAAADAIAQATPEMEHDEPDVAEPEDAD